ncbi:5-formyltetrahydrofolate cyclo-ligase [Levilactobacillus zymae]|uniref:5-formyltetrahydrofolate cyclo-ligase n=1 Tax=Levilactobacillus zymae TaxID=267363 RepID=A0ABQ0WVC9_9LACO|nr:5-formyltetrahydrofolate cyclo-ligase [Levilactobacillus zymae]QFR60459.1 5-formyltetrahydrofolate cyclo-ligase [Levilactobacillus zymae]GEO71809.1 5-formyltetrahydrofolate cyclo-ligase [Levilactobacillus zymae]
MDKATLRQQTIQALSQMPADQRQAASERLYQALWTSPQWRAAQTVATTLSSAIELNTQPIIARAQAEGKTVAVPQTRPHRQMAFRPLTATTTLMTTKFGLQEPQDGPIIAPADFDLIVVPGLKFATTGERLGFGGGYYDRYLPQTTGYKVALALPAQQASQPSWPVEDFDVVLDAVLNA